MFDRPYRRTVITRAGSVECVCGADAGYRIWKRGSGGAGSLYRCPACANSYPAPHYESEPLPHIKADDEARRYEAYVQHRATMSPEQVASAFRDYFEGRGEQLEARYQAERARRAS